jgi:iron complex outermembrane receptor protein
MKKSAGLLRLLATGVATWTLMSPAYAQSTPAEQAPAADAGVSQSTGLTEIVVTARRREEKLQSVPISATALSGESLERRNIQSMQDLFGQVPSLTVGGAGQQRSTENVTIRGQGSTFNAAPGVVLYFAEVPIIADQRNNAQGAGGANFYDLANVQVLRGPQGTLFGRNTTGGAVLFEPQRPVDRFEGYAQVQYGNYDSVELRGAINVPIVADKLLLRVAGLYQNRKGFTQELTTNTDLDDRNRYSIRAGLTWRPADGIENYLMATVTHGQEHGSSTVLNAVPAGNDPASGRTYLSFLQDQVARGIRSVRLSPGMLWSERTRYFSITDIFSADLSDAITFRNVANYSRLKHNSPLDPDGFPDNYAARVAAGQSEIGGIELTPGGFADGHYLYTTDARQYSIEPQLQGKFGDGALTFAVGGYYENVKPLSLELGSAANPTERTQTSHSKALYAQGTLSFGSFVESLSGLRLTAGYRYTWDALTATSNFGLPHAAATSTSGKYKAPNWTVGLDYDVFQHVLLFAKVSRGYKTGGVGTATPAPQLRTFQPEFVTSYEVGVKADWHIGDIPVRTNVNYYYTKYKDLQRTGGTSYIYTDPTTGITAPVFGAQTTNAGKAHIQGIEFEGEIRPTRWFTLSGSYSYLDAKYDEYSQASLFPNGIPPFRAPGFDCGAGVPYNAATGRCILTGLPFQYAPKNQFSLTGRIDLPIDEAMGKVSLTTTYAYVDAQYTSPSKSPIAEPYAYIGGNCPRNAVGSVICGSNNGYGLLSMNLQWQGVAGSNFDLSAFATNLTNVDYVISSNATGSYGGFNSLIYGEPRMYGMSVRYRF